jgi:penicillin-binding protein 1C
VSGRTAGGIVIGLFACLSGVSPRLAGASRDGANALREPQRERSGSHWISNDKSSSVRLEEPPSLGGVSKGVVAHDQQTLRETAAERLPTFADVRAAYQPSDIALLDRHGAVIHEVRVDKQRRRLAWTPLADISPALQAAVLASEDRRFYRHHGVDGWALMAAALQLLRGGPRRGASTISMQLATHLDPQLQRRRGGWSAFPRKWRQMRLARALERQWSKREILEAYLNLVTFRGELQGVAAATHVLFGKVPHGITESEALVLAVLLRAPNATTAAVTQRATLLHDAVESGAAQADLVAATTEALSAPPGTGPRVALAPHAARQLLRGATPTAPVESTLDAAVQRVATDVLRRHLLALRERWVHDGAVLVVDNASGDVLAYVGGAGDDLSSARYVDGIRARRQAGSALKPFLYGLALEQRLLTPASLVEDLPLEIPVTGGLYRPQNYDEQFRGLVTVRTALAASLNIPAVRTLQLVGGEAFVQQLRRLGFAGVVESGEYYGPSLALGSADVTLWEMVTAYRTLANGGVWSPLRMRPEDAAAITARPYSEATAFLVSNILADRDSRTTTFGLDNVLATRFWSAVKTGTSKEMRDNWCIGYSRRYTVGVWVGNFSGQPMRDVSGISGAAPVWVDLMNWLHRDTPSVPPDPPAGVGSEAVTFADGIEPTRLEWFRDGTQPGTAQQALAESHPHIVAPAPGTIIALDPDIPAARQRVAFEAQLSGPPSRWSLDGTDLGAADKLLLWQPERGRHTMQLVGVGQHVLDSVTFVVRGGM